MNWNKTEIQMRHMVLGVINWLHHEICILDTNGTHIGVAATDFALPGMDPYPYNHLRMFFMGDKLVIALDSHVKVYNITRKSQP